MDIEEEEEVLELPQMKIKELRDLNESFVQVPEVVSRMVFYFYCFLFTYSIPL